MKKKIAYTLLYSFGIFFIVYYFVLKSVMGIIAFSKYLLFGGIILCLCPLIDQFYSKNKVYKIFLRILKPLFFIGLIVFVITEIFIVGYSVQNNMKKSDYTIVLGAGLRGSKLSITLTQRVNKALEYINQGDDTGYLVVSGGQGVGEDITEAEGMKRFFIDNGIDSERIIKEENSTDTYQNLQFSKELIERHSGKSIEELNIKIVSSGFHLARAKLLCNALGFKNVTLCGSEINPIFIPTYYIREFIGFYKMLVFDIILR